MLIKVFLLIQLIYNQSNSATDKCIFALIDHQIIIVRIAYIITHIFTIRKYVLITINVDYNFDTSMRF
jgi:hypothetical protein